MCATISAIYWTSLEMYKRFYIEMSFTLQCTEGLFSLINVGYVRRALARFVKTRFNSETGAPALGDHTKLLNYDQFRVGCILQWVPMIRFSGKLHWISNFYHRFYCSVTWRLKTNLDWGLLCQS